MRTHMIYYAYVRREKSPPYPAVVQYPGSWSFTRRQHTRRVQMAKSGKRSDPITALYILYIYTNTHRGYALRIIKIIFSNDNILCTINIKYAYYYLYWFWRWMELVCFQVLHNSTYIIYTRAYRTNNYFGEKITYFYYVVIVVKQYTARTRDGVRCAAA